MAGKKDKGPKAKKGKKRQRSAGSGPEIPPDKIPEFLLCIKIEACKLSIAHFRGEYQEIKDGIKITRATFKKLSQNAYEKVQEYLDKIDQLNAKELRIDKAGIEYEKEMQRTQISLLRENQYEVEKLQIIIDQLENQNEKKNKELEDLNIFRDIPDSVLADEYQASEDKYYADKEQHELMIEKIFRKHESSMQNCALQSDNRINAAEGIACERELATMDLSKLGDIKFNGVLKKQIKATEENYIKMERHLQTLEDRHIELTTKNIQVDWNLNYDFAINLKITREESLKETVKLPHIFAPSNLKTKGEEIIKSEIYHRKVKDKLEVLGQKAVKTYASEKGPANFYSPVVNQINKEY